MGHRMSRSEIEGIMTEFGTGYMGDDGQSNYYLISANQMLDLISWQGCGPALHM